MAGKKRINDNTLMLYKKLRRIECKEVRRIAMMTINNVNSGMQSITSGKVSATANESRNLENQITNKQQRLNHLSSDAKMTAQEKAKERQEIQRQIAELNRKLRLERLEQEKEKAEAVKKEEKKKVFKEEMFEKTDAEKQADENSMKQQEEKVEEISVSTVNMQKMLSVGSLTKQEQITESVDRKKEGRENVLEAEIQSDELYGSDTKAKREELSESRRKRNFLIEQQTQPEPKEVRSLNENAKIVIRE